MWAPGSVERVGIKIAANAVLGQGVPCSGGGHFGSLRDQTVHSLEGEGRVQTPFSPQSDPGTRA